jgi:hypothetical protein
LFQVITVKGSSWINSFFIPPNQNVACELIVGPGVVTSSITGATVSLGSPASGAWSEAILAGGKYAGIATGYQQVYIDELGGIGFAVPVTSLAATFPASALPLAFLVVDSAGRIQSVIDVRPSSLSAAPDLGTGMKESVSDATKRVNFQNNYSVPRTAALTPQIPQDLSLPAPGFFLGSGSVLLSSNVITTPKTYLSTATNGKLAVNAINQGYIDPGSGLLAIRQVQTSGVFPTNSLALFEATTDSVGLIRNLVDWRPSYI